MDRIIRGLFCCVMAAMCVPAVTWAGAVPNGIIDVTVRQKEDGKIGKSYHLLNLFCWEGDCSLTWVSLNQCLGGAGYPKVERTSTREGNLHVTEAGGMLRIKQTMETGTGLVDTTLRIGYEKAGGVMAWPTSFSGGFVKESALLDKVITVEYVPLKGVSNKVTMDCPFDLPGVIAPTK